MLRLLSPYPSRRQSSREQLKALKGLFTAVHGAMASTLQLPKSYKHLADASLSSESSEASSSAETKPFGAETSTSVLFYFEAF